MRVKDDPTGFRLNDLIASLLDYNAVTPNVRVRRSFDDLRYTRPIEDDLEKYEPLDFAPVPEMKKSNEPEYDDDEEVLALVRRYMGV